MATLYITALGYQIDGKSAGEAYECLNTNGYLDKEADRRSVVALIELAQKRVLDDTDADPWRAVQEDLVKADVLSRKGRSAVRQWLTAWQTCPMVEPALRLASMDCGSREESSECDHR